MSCHAADPAQFCRGDQVDASYGRPHPTIVSERHDVLMVTIHARRLHSNKKKKNWRPTGGPSEKKKPAIAPTLWVVTPMADAFRQKCRDAFDTDSEPSQMLDPHLEVHEAHGLRHL